MSQAHSISTHRRHGLARVCDIWGVSRARLYRQRAPDNAEASRVFRRLLSVRRSYHEQDNEQVFA